MAELAIDRIVDALHKHGSTVRTRGAGRAEAQCPSHDDGSPSLALKQIEAQVLVYCHGYCDTADVVAALGLTMADLYDDRRGATYRYDNGRTVQRSYSGTKKKFVQHNTDRPAQLYHLSRLRAAGEGGIFLVEGEKDVHAIEAVDGVATTAPQGAGSFHKVDVSPLAGRHITVVVDKDGAGANWAADVRRTVRPVAAGLRFVQAAAGKDAADHIAAAEEGHELEGWVPFALPDEVWDTPTPVDEIDRTPLPESAGRYPQNLWTFVDAVAESLQVPRDMVFLLVLSILSTASGGRWQARISQDWSEPLALMTVTSMMSGSRKSGTVKAVAAPLFEVERDLVAQAAPQVTEQKVLKDLRTAELEKLKRKGTDGKADAEANVIAAAAAVDEIDEIVMPRLLADDITPERLGGLMAEQGGRMGVISAEGTIFAILAGRYSSGQPNLDLVLKAHAGDPVRVDRTSRPPLMLDDPFLAIGVTVQPDIIEGLAETRLFRGSGLLARFLFATPEDLVGSRNLDAEPVPEKVKRAYAAGVKAMARAAWSRDEPVELSLTPEAAKILRAFRGEMEPRLSARGGDLAEIRDWASKLPGHLVRIAALLTLFDNARATEISGTAMDGARELADYLISEALTAFDTINGRHARAARPRAVLAWLKRKQLSDFTVRQARRDLGGQAWAQDVTNLRDVLDELEDLGWIRERTTPQDEARGAGRPASPRYDVNPEARR